MPPCNVTGQADTESQSALTSNKVANHFMNIYKNSQSALKRATVAAEAAEKIATEAKMTAYNVFEKEAAAAASIEAWTAAIEAKEFVAKAQEEIEKLRALAQDTYKYFIVGNTQNVNKSMKNATTGGQEVEKYANAAISKLSEVLQIVERISKEEAKKKADKVISANLAKAEASSAAAKAAKAAKEAESKKYSAQDEGTQWNVNEAITKAAEAAKAAKAAAEAAEAAASEAEAEGAKAAEAEAAAEVAALAAKAAVEAATAAIAEFVKVLKWVENLTSHEAKEKADKIIGVIAKNAPISIKRNTEEKSDTQIITEILGVVAKNKLKSMASKLLHKSPSNSSR